MGEFNFLKDKKTISAAILVPLAAFLVLYAQTEISDDTKSMTEDVLTGAFGQGQMVFIEVADSEAERIQGLSGRKNLGGDEGLLFVFERDDFHGIWMKDMNFAIDIIWLDGELEVVDIKKNALPESFPQIFRPASSARYVLETLAGFSDNRLVKIGDKLGLSGEI